MARRTRRPTPANEPTLATLLESTDPTEQYAKVAALIEMVQHPAMTIVLHVNQMTGAITMAPVGLTLSYDQMHAILLAAQAQLRVAEQQARQQQALPATDGSIEPPSSDS